MRAPQNLHATRSHMRAKWGLMHQSVGKGMERGPARSHERPHGQARADTPASPSETALTALRKRPMEPSAAKPVTPPCKRLRAWAGTRHSSRHLSAPQRPCMAATFPRRLHLAKFRGACHPQGLTPVTVPFGLTGAGTRTPQPLGDTRQGHARASWHRPHSPASSALSCPP